MNDDFEKALELAPNNSALRRVYADWLEEQGRLAEARYQREIAGDPNRGEEERYRLGCKAELDTTTNSAVYRKVLKEMFAGCSRCPWHGGENISHRPAHTSWKKSRKRRWRDS
jgi:uncharacterized protein (TIGR02996 family)